MKKQKNKLLQWHAAFYADIQIELEDEAEHLIFENEHMLGTKPKQIDVLITKKDAGINIRKNIGQIFRKYNLIEYKGPNDSLTINDFHKMLGYAYFYIADTTHVNEIKSEEITISFVCARYPRKLMSHLCAKGHTVKKKEEGLFYVYGVEFPVQIIVNPHLSQEKNLWLSNLTNRISDTESIEQMVRVYKDKKDNKLYSSVMDIVIRSNEEKFSEVKDMCEALKELFREELEESWNNGRNVGISQGISQGINQGFSALVNSLKVYVKDAEELYQAVTNNEAYKDTPREEILKYLK